MLRLVSDLRRLLASPMKMASSRQMLTKSSSSSKKCSDLANSLISTCIPSLTWTRREIRAGWLTRCLSFQLKMEVTLILFSNSATATRTKSSVMLPTKAKSMEQILHMKQLRLWLERQWPKSTLTWMITGQACSWRTLIHGISLRLVTAPGVWTCPSTLLSRSPVSCLGSGRTKTAPKTAPSTRFSSSTAPKTCWPANSNSPTWVSCQRK